MISANEPGPIGSMAVSSLLDALSSKSPAPGGGAAAGLVGAAAAAAMGMVVAYSIGRKAHAEHGPMLEDVSARLARARSLLLALADEDAHAYAALNALMRLPEDAPERVAGWTNALDGALAPPRATLAAACDLLRLGETLVGTTNPHLRSDLAVGAVLARAAAHAAAWNIAVNTPMLAHEVRERTDADTARALADADERAARIESGCR